MAVEEISSKLVRVQPLSHMIETSKNTAIHSTLPAPAIRFLYKNKTLKPGMRVLDFGAGTTDRNAKYLRGKGLDVYSYDPYNGQRDIDGWSGVSSILTCQDFDLVYTSFVLNTVDERVERNIVAITKLFASVQIHIVRNKDIVEHINKTIKRDKGITCDFIKENYKDYDDVNAISVVGVKTSKGYQRIPILEKYNHELMKETYGYKIYKGVAK